MRMCDSFLVVKKHINDQNQETFFQYIINEHFRTFWNSGISVDKYLNFFPKNAENFYTNILAPFLLSVAYYTRGGINLEGIWKSQI